MKRRARPREALPRLTLLAALLFSLPAASSLRAQAGEGIMSAAEVESLRDAAYIPSDRIVAFEKILDTRSARVDALLKGRRHVNFAEDLHEFLDQIEAIADELNDNLDGFRDKHRDVRKVLPRLLEETDRWSHSLEATPEDEQNKVVRKLAIDSVKDVREQAAAMQPELEAYFLAHPDAAKAEKERADHAHEPHR